MIFAHRQVASLQSAGVVCETFLLGSRTSPWVLAKEWRRLRQTIRHFRPDLLHAQYGTMTAFFAAMSARLPLVVTYRGSDLNHAPKTPWARSFAGRMLSQVAALRASQIICVSEQLKRKLWLRRRHAVVIPSAVDTGIFYPRPRDEARAELGWGSLERVVLFNAGGNPAVKRLDLAQAAVDCARRMCGDIRFVVLNGDVSPEIIPVMMNAADCLLLTSDSEGSPTVVQEALACSLPVVSVDVGDVSQRLEGVCPSRIVDRNPEDLGRAVTEILTCARRSNGGSKIRNVSCSTVAQQTICVYRSALSQDASPA
jgi:teichuronic acid biosynthesis glycosyltransferase TuaC